LQPATCCGTTHCGCCPVETVIVTAPAKVVVVEPEKKTSVTLGPNGATVKTKDVSIDVKK